MSEPRMSDDDGRTVQILAFAAREFDRAVDLLVGVDEPGEQEVETSAASGGAADAAKEDAGSRDGGLARRVFSVAGSAGRAARRAATGTVHPRHPDWETADLSGRIEWWIQRFGTAGAAVASVPGLAGKLGRITAVGDVVGAATQVLVVNAVAHEMGVDDPARRVAAAARIVLGKDLDEQAVSAMLTAADTPAYPDARPESEVAGDAPQERTGALARVGRTATLVWQVAKRLVNLRFEVGNRPQGNLASRTLRNLPVVGAAAAFVAERGGISQAAQQARAAFDADTSG